MQHSPGFLALVNEVKPRIKEISVQDAAERSKTAGVFLVDVREESEWMAGRAVGAIHLGKGVIERDIEERIPDKGAPILCYCGGGYRSALVADNLQKMGYTHVRSIVGGYKAWVGSGLPVTTRLEVLPRSPHEKLGGIVHLARLVDKARLFPMGKLPGYNYLTTGFDKSLLDFLCLEPGVLEQIVKENTEDARVVSALKVRLGPGWPSDHAVVEFNQKMTNRKPDTADKQARFEQSRAGMPSARRKIETYFDLIDLEEGRLS